MSRVDRTSTESQPPALELRGIGKRFGAVVANSAVNFVAQAGQVHALVGENGAGKSTLMHIAYGLLQPDTGSILIGGEAVGARYSPRVAMAKRVGMVHQHFMLLEPMTVVENVILGREPTHHGVLDIDRASREIEEVAQKFGLEIEPLARVSDLSVGEKQRVEIIKTLWRGCDVLILDEPTAVLSPFEVRSFFAVLRNLTASGMAVILITHKLDEVVEIANRITVMRRGAVVAELDAAAIRPEQIAQAMVGRSVLLNVEQTPAKPKQVALSLDGVRVRRRRGDLALSSLSFEVRSGEILGIAGVEGNGQSELIEVICGLRPLAAGKICLGDTDISTLSVSDRRQLGLVHIPEDRHRRGLILEFSSSENLILGRTKEFTNQFGLDFARIEKHAADEILRNDIRPRDPGVLSRSLSGGNQQKVVIARELGNPAARVLIASQPTRGVDVGAIERIHRQLIAARDAGMAIVLISAELSEIRTLSDRAIVLYRGQAVALFDASELASADALDRIGAVMTGADGVSASSESVDSRRQEVEER